MEMPTPCYDCEELFELNDLRMCFKCRDGRKLRCDSCDAEHDDDLHRAPKGGAR